MSHVSYPTTDLDVDLHEIVEDVDGVRHWRYRLAGTRLLLVCGKETVPGSATVDDFPNCLYCIYITARDAHR